MRLATRVCEVYRLQGFPGVRRQVREKLAYWKRRLTFRPHVINKLLAGHTFKVAINNLFAKGWVEERERWPELEWIHTNLLEPGDFVVDCGANMGFTTVFFAHFVGPSGRVVAFEPLPSNAEDIRQNVALNDLNNVDIRQAAVGSANTEATIALTPNGVLTSDRSWRLITVPVVRLDDAVKEGTPTFLKVDVEGFELEVLKGAQRVLSFTPKLDIEIHIGMRSDKRAHCRELLTLLASHPYEFFIQRGIDAPIQHFTYSDAELDDLIKYEVVNVFARPCHK